jgi:hypothetical protein
MVSSHIKLLAINEHGSHDTEVIFAEAQSLKKALRASLDAASLEILAHPKRDRRWNLTSVPTSNTDTS